MKAEKEEEEQTHRVRASTNLPTLEVVWAWRATHHPRQGSSSRRTKEQKEASGDQDVPYLGLVPTPARVRLPGHHHMRPEEAHPEVRSPPVPFKKKLMD